MNDNTIRQVILLGTLAIVGIITVQTYWVVNAWDTQEEEFDRTAMIALRKAAEALAELDSVPLPDRDLIKRRSSNYYVVNFNNVIDANNLEFYLQKSLEEHHINSDFEYGIFDCSSDEMVYGDYCSLSEMGVTPREVQLPKYDEFTYYFGVRFLGRNASILNKMQISILFTAILLIAILFFAYSMFVILKQKRLSEMQKDFINNMTHEFKTPISTIQISAGVFLDDPRIKENPRLNRYAQIIKEQNQRLNGQVEKVLQIARLEQDNFKLNPESINLNELLEEIVESTELKIKDLEGNITTEFAESDPIIQADKLHFTNIMYNLLDNSIKYCREKPVITLRTEQLGRKVRLSLEDNGIGIAPDQISKVFDKFHRVPTGNVHNVKGFGLGLFYVKNIVNAHGWKIKIDSEPNQGTKISVTIG